MGTDILRATCIALAYLLPIRAGGAIGGHAAGA